MLDSIDEAIERTEEVIATTERLRDALLHDLLSRGLPGRHTEWKEVRGLGAIPAAWDVVRLGEVCEVVGGATPARNTSEYWGGDTPWVTPTEITELPGRALTRSRETISAEGMKSAAMRVIPAGSVLLSSRATIGATAINTIPVTTNQGFQNLIPGSSTHGMWLYHLATGMRHELERRSTGSTFLEVSRTGVSSLRVPFPLLDEQHESAVAMDSIDETLERNVESHDKLKVSKHQPPRRCSRGVCEYPKGDPK